jgi:hypothetical protein
MDSLTARFYRDVFLPYVDFLKAKYRFHRRFSHAKRVWEDRLNAKELVNGPYLEKSQVYRDGVSLDEMSLHEGTKQTIRKRLGERSLWRHQTDALQLVLGGRNTVVANLFCEHGRVRRAAASCRIFDQHFLMNQVFDVAQGSVGRAFGELRPLR